MMPENSITIPDAALAELDRLHAAATPGEWKFGSSKGGRWQVHANGQQVAMVWHTTAHPASSTGAYIAALHNAYPALRQRLNDAESRLAEARKENDFMRLRLAESDKDCVYCDLPKAEMGRCASGFPGCARSDDLFHCAELTRRDAKQRREGAIEALEGIAKDEGIDGGKAYIAKVVYREFPDLMHTSVGVVDASDLMAAAQRLRDGGK